MNQPDPPAADQPAPKNLDEEFPPFDPPELFEPDVPVAEESPAAPVPPKSDRLVIPGIILAATAVIIFLWLQNHRLQIQVDRLNSDAAKMRAQIEKLPGLPGGTNSSVPKILSAVYGAGAHFTDVTDRVTDLFAQPEIEFAARPQWLQADPAPGWNKQLMITYEFHGQRRMFSTGEGGGVSVKALIEQH